MSPIISKTIEVYYEQEKRITNLAKEHYKTKNKIIESLSEQKIWLKKLPNYVVDFDDALSFLVKIGSHFRIILSRAFTEEDPNANNTQKELNNLIDGCGIAITGMRRYSGEISTKWLIGKAKEDTIVEMDLTDVNTGETRIARGCQHYTHKSDCRVAVSWRLKKKPVGTTVDLGATLALLFIMKTVKVRIREIDGLSYAQKQYDTLFTNAMEYWCCFEDIPPKNAPIVRPNVITSYFSDWPKFISKTFMIGNDVKLGSNSDISKRMFEKLGVELKKVDLPEIKLRQSHSSSEYPIYGQQCILLRGDQYYLAAGLSPYFNGLCGMKSYFDLCGKDPFLHYVWDRSAIGEYILPFILIYIEKHEEALESLEMQDVCSEYARSFQTKKCIPKETLKAMVKSKLNCLFGYVEYDGNCNLNLVNEKEDEILEFMNSYLPFVDVSNYILRFRALGNHKASGIYYPYYRCMCVDYRFTDSFVHELGHLLDYHYDNLSQKPEFSKIRTSYRQAMERAGGTKAFKTTGKYTLSYYLMPTEIFARSFELYLSHVRGIRNGLVPSIFIGTEYPIHDYTFMLAITQYFDCFFFNRAKLLSI